MENEKSTEGQDQTKRTAKEAIAEAKRLMKDGRIDEALVVLSDENIVWST